MALPANDLGLGVRPGIRLHLDEVVHRDRAQAEDIELLSLTFEIQSS
jgi:hypothetical protein